MVRFFSLLFCFVIAYCAQSQVLPKEGSSLNYRLIGFTFPPPQDVIRYKIEIAAGTYNSTDSFRKRVIKSIESKNNKIVAEVPVFGSSYTWRVAYIVKNKGVSNSPFYHFSTRMSSRVDTSNMRLRILHPATQYKDHYVALDAGAALYDMSGRPIWYIPDTQGFDGYVADMKFTSKGTVTFIYGSPCEIDYNGNLLWQAKGRGVVNGDTLHGEIYHHEFTRLSNDHYMALGMELIMCQLVSVGDSSYIIFSKDKNKSEQDGFHRGRFGTLIEYDEKGNVVWSWKSYDYMARSDFAYYAKSDSNQLFDPHDNAFYFDEKNKWIYIGFRNLNRVIKIEYPSGKVLRIYGDAFKPGMRGSVKGLFCNQHNIGRTQDGDLYFFNNNSCRLTDSMPTVVVIREPGSPTDTFTKVWEYTCTVEGNYPKNFNSGGNAVELPDRSMFVNMGSKYSKLFIVNKQKKILWSALPEIFIQTDRKWVPNHQDRANIISRHDVERMIWNAEK